MRDERVIPGWEQLATDALPEIEAALDRLALDVMTDPELLSLAIERSGLSVRQFASEKLTRDPRTVFRWLAGDNPLPKAVREYCTQLIIETAQPEESP